MKRLILIVLLAVVAVSGSMVFAQEAAAEASGTPAASGSVWKYFAAALAVGISCIAGGIAVGQIGAAAMGAMSENPELSGKALPYAGLAEGICLWGFLVALLILIF
ncbi:ATP synthase subunit C [Breznakiella homolactica]|uniref:ATPase n=1 Tax=Breznakiella homolactica TaxID=2798577 RepID=A0A7T7XRQ7_9SPIR|nr:ATP synthase subunit C [Breznakiella homolactica]QQO11227.1 ATP synthase subunit C [Breznakiella homolactica]